MYEQAQITDVDAFYQDKFAYDADFDFATRPLNFLTARHFKQAWFYGLIKPGSRVLDFGCGSGTLAALKRKGCELYGVDYSAPALRIAKERNGYDEVFRGEIQDAPFPPASFDYVTSQDVLGHIEFTHKDAVIERLKHFLKPGGTMLHGIECGPVDYAAMSPEALADFVRVEGHVGIEDREANLARFRRFFRFADGQVRFDVVLPSVDEYLKQASGYQFAVNSVLQRFLRTLNSEEIAVFDTASGVTLLNAEMMQTPCHPYAHGFLFLRASDSPLPEMPDLFPGPFHLNLSDLIRDEDFFFRGWHGLEETEGRERFRWSGASAWLHLAGYQGYRLNLTVFSHHPALGQGLDAVEVLFVREGDGALVQRLLLRDRQPVALTLDIDAADWLIQLHVNTTYIPRYTADACRDGRIIGIGVQEPFLSWSQRSGEPAVCAS